MHKRFAGTVGGALGEAVRTLFDAVDGKPRMERFTARTRNCVRAASQRAVQLRHPFVGTEHLVLGFFAEPACLAAKILDRHGVTRENVEETVVARLAPRADAVPADPPLTPWRARSSRRALPPH